VFSGWFTDNNTFQNQFTATTPVSADMTVYAKWTEDIVLPVTYTVTFDSNEGSSVTAISGVTAGGTVPALPANPTKAGFVFNGWFTDNNTFQNQFTATTPVSANMTVYAKWVSSDTRYTISFDSKGGSAVAAIGGIAPGGTVPALPEAPTKVGDTFAGWFTDEALTVPFTTATLVNADMTVYAKWTALPVYTVTFDSNGGSTVAAKTAIVQNTAVGTLPANPTKAGFVFSGWFTDNNTFLNQFTAATVVTADITVYAQWTAAVTFDSTGGSAVAAKTGIVPGATVGTLPANPTRANYRFDGWFIDNTTFLTQFTAATPVDANITVYAKWTALYTVTFDSNGGSSVAAIANIPHGSTVTSMPANPTKANSVFEGWYLDNASFTNAFVPTNPVTTNITAYAKWKTWLTAPQLAPTLETKNELVETINRTDLDTNTIMDYYFAAETQSIISGYPAADQDEARRVIIGGGYPPLIRTKTLKDITWNQTLFEYTPNWNNADLNLSVIISSISASSVTTAITSVIELSLGHESVGHLTASITHETSTTVATAQGLTTNTQWNLTQYDPAYQYKAVLVGDVYIYEYVWSAPNAVTGGFFTMSKGPTRKFAVVWVDPASLQMILISRPKQ
jgi:uncharacterized repeat protein (TIGR02543 family)